MSIFKTKSWVISGKFNRFYLEITALNGDKFSTTRAGDITQNYFHNNEFNSFDLTFNEMCEHYMEHGVEIDENTFVVPQIIKLLKTDLVERCKTYKSKYVFFPKKPVVTEDLEVTEVKAL